MMMKNLRNTLMTITAVIAMTACMAQDLTPQEQDVPNPQERDPKAREKIEAARIGMITNRLGLTPEQAEKFWPIYREFSEKRMELRREFKTEQEKMKPGSPNQEQQKKLLDLGLDIKQRELDLEKSYSGRLLKVISTEQMLNLRTAERDFQRMIMNQLQHRRNIQQRKENFRERNQNLRERKN
jgi:hypothetical protein